MRHIRFAVRAVTVALAAAACSEPAGVPTPRAGVSMVGAWTTAQGLPCGPVAGATPLVVTGGTARDHALACVALQRALGFFEAQGLAPDRRVVLEFPPAVVWDRSVGAVAIDAPTRPADGRPDAGAAEQVAGLFDHAHGTVLMTSEAVPWLRRYSYFDLPMSDEMITAVLAHEIGHALSRSLYAPGLHAPDADLRVQDEYVAYVVQLATMAPALRAEILASFPARPGGADEAAINALALDLGPEAFGVQCFRHFGSAAGGAAFLRRLYSGAFVPAVAF